jgi:SAM-dependent methyltransferase
MNSQNIESALHAPDHDLVGGLPEVFGPWHLRWLAKAGGVPTSTVLDLGCGTLRFGLFALCHLDSGRYWGIEPRLELLDRGRTLARRANLLHRAAALEDLDWLDRAAPLGCDFVVTQSVLNHLDEAGIVQTVARVGRHLADHGIWLGTAAFDEGVHRVDPGQSHPTRAGERLHSRIQPQWFGELLEGHELSFAREGVDHPRGLDGFRASRRESSQ